jgi:hypothetical protein
MSDEKIQRLTDRAFADGIDHEEQRDRLIDLVTALEDALSGRRTWETRLGFVWCGQHPCSECRHKGRDLLKGTPEKCDGCTVSPSNFEVIK